MGNETGKKSKKGPVVKIPTPAEIKTFIMIAQNKLTLFRNKKIALIKTKKMEIAKCLKENNLDVAKAKMDSLIREEDYITSYDILGPLLEILKERVTYIVTSTECPPDLRAQLDSVIYASTRLEFEELFRLRDLIMRKYGAAYIAKAESNADKLVNVNLVEKLRIKPASDAFVTIRLKQLCKEQKIPFEFPCEINSDIPGDIGNPFDQGGVNPYGGGNDFNPYGPPSGGNHHKIIILMGLLKIIILMGHHKIIILMDHLKIIIHMDHHKIIIHMDHHKIIILMAHLKIITTIHMDLHKIIIVILMVHLQIIILMDHHKIIIAILMDHHHLRIIIVILMDHHHLRIIIIILMDLHLLRIIMIHLVLQKIIIVILMDLHLLRIIMIHLALHKIIIIILMILQTIMIIITHMAQKVMIVIILEEISMIT